MEAIVLRLGRFIERRQAETALAASEKRFRDLVENSLTGISIVQNHQVVYQNKEQERLLGPLPRRYLLGNVETIHPDDVAGVVRFAEQMEFQPNFLRGYGFQMPSGWHEGTGSPNAVGAVPGQSNRIQRRKGPY